MTNLLDIGKFVLKYMLEKKGRVFLTIAGIIIGIFTFSFIIFLSQGIENAVVEQFSAFGVNVIGIQSADNGGGGPPGGGGLTDTDIAKVQQVVRNYKYIAPGIFFSNGLFEYGREKTVIVTLAYPDEYWDEVGKDLDIEIEEGRTLRPGDSGVVVLGHKTAMEAFGEGNELSLGNAIKYGDKTFRVIGIIKERGDLFVDSSMLMSFDDIQEISGQDTYTLIRVSLTDNADMEFYKEALDRKLNPNNDEKRVSITSPDQAIERFQEILGVLRIILASISGIALIVGGINVMNTMYSNILERINEISVMKALGATNWDILIMFLLESSILGILGALFGFGFAYGLAEIVSYVVTNYFGYNVPVYFSFDFFLIIVLGTAFFAMLFGTLPAVKAAGVDPADNLRDE